MAAVEFQRIMARPAPPVRQPAPGELDFARINAWALDRLGDLLRLTAPLGRRETTPAGAIVWQGFHPARPLIVQVCLFTGAWAEPVTCKGGRDLVSFAAHVFGLSPGAAARRLAAWLGIEAVRHV